MMIGQSPEMQELRARIGRVAGTHFTVLVEGESGVGKELVARAVHDASPRRGGPFVAVNCAALVDSLLEAELFGIEDRTATGVRGRRGKFELADHGTLFLDEIADLSMTAQAKLLRVLQDLSVERVGGSTPHRVDTRIVAATNRDLGELVERGHFRADLFYRVAGVELEVPPLRARRPDIPLLVDYFRGRLRRTRLLPFSKGATEALMAYQWPGNVRQLARVVERALALSPGPDVKARDLPSEIGQRFERRPALSDGDHTLRTWSSRYVRQILDQCGGNKRRACDTLDISYKTLQTLLEHAAHEVGHTSADQPATAMAHALYERAG